MPQPSRDSPHAASTAMLVLDVAARIDFDPAFRTAVDRSPQAELLAAGVPLDLATAFTASDDVTAFDGGARAVAARAHAWAMQVLREG